VNQKQNIRKTAFAMLLVLSIQLVFAASTFTGIVDDKVKSNKYSLRSLNNFSKKGLSLNAIKANLQYKGLQLSLGSSLIHNNEVNSMLQYNSGNTTYIYPYKFKVKVPKFKTPQSSH
jgi:hypothetical protein